MFHTSRCGSTLFAKALAQEPSNSVVVQPGPFQHGFWSAVTKGFTEPLDANEDSLRACRKLMMLVTRRRHPQHRQAFVKFISWNALYIDFIMEAFPNVPAIYLYRDPIEIVASVRKSTTAVLEAKDRKQGEMLTGLSRPEIDRLDATAYLARCYREAFAAIAAYNSSRLSLLDYEALTSARFAEILDSSFGYRPSPQSLAKMRSQFDTYSKDDSSSKSFEGDRERKHAMISDADRRLISDITGRQLHDLRRDPRNIFPPPALGEQQATASKEPALVTELT
ncbi:MAG: sulfotransferase [Alphaproteobacteria bacterium]|nr:sulfotransferase [Alphaproteobacteria bacterium]